VWIERQPKRRQIPRFGCRARFAEDALMSDMYAIEYSDRDTRFGERIKINKVLDLQFGPSIRVSLDTFRRLAILDALLMPSLQLLMH
jgi:hypothetical protein